MLAALITGIFIAAACADSSTKQNDPVFATRAIGDQEWMISNLDVDTFRNGDPIPHAKTTEEWLQAAGQQQPAWCYLNNDPANSQKYGKLYNWFAVNDPRGLAPEGFHVPTEKEWDRLIGFLQAENNGDFNEWNTPGGYRNHDGRFLEPEEKANWWAGDKSMKILAVNYTFDPRSKIFKKQASDQPIGFSVRCLRD